MSFTLVKVARQVSDVLILGIVRGTCLAAGEIANVRIWPSQITLHVAREFDRDSMMVYRRDIVAPQHRNARLLASVPYRKRHRVVHVNGILVL